ncbi:hypothetical protein WR25_22611 [Diploscapter pachys]|uniref:Uncharacterized protein n=1 Tax=Diploscapter pachys TaxID=2018661 RepID=A0A2A2KHQ1_9BILA|nr:hypothetical protein WR25_22611 [Diploscapter pachys]
MFRQHRIADLRGRAQQGEFGILHLRQHRHDLQAGGWQFAAEDAAPPQAAGISDGGGDECEGERGPGHAPIGREPDAEHVDRQDDEQHHRGDPPRLARAIAVDEHAHPPPVPADDPGDGGEQAGDHREAERERHGGARDHPAHQRGEGGMADRRHVRCRGEAQARLFDEG